MSQERVFFHYTAILEHKTSGSTYFHKKNKKKFSKISQKILKLFLQIFLQNSFRIWI